MLRLVVMPLAAAAVLAGGRAADAQTAPPRDDDAGGSKVAGPALPEGVTLDAMLDTAALAPPESWPEPIHDDPVIVYTQLELLEYRLSDHGSDELGWDTQGWIGTDGHRFWWKSEGEWTFEGPDEGDADVQALYACPLTAFWYFQVGARYDVAWSPQDTDGRFSGVLGVQGIAPYEVDVEPSLYITQDADVLFELKASFDIDLTQRLVLQPRLDLDVSAQDILERNVAAGINDIALSLRLRYEIRRELAPYIGVRWDALLGETANLAQQAGDRTSNTQLVMGVRIAF